MLRNVSGLRGYHIGATDGNLGKVCDFYFDQTWVVRYIVVDTGDWLRERRVLISPTVILRADWANRVIAVGLTRQQVKDSPDVDTDKPVSQQVQIRLARHYGWPAYVDPRIPQPGAVEMEEEVTAPTAGTDDASIRSAREVTGYSIEAVDGFVGHVEDFVVEDEGWGVRYMVVDTQSWLPGRKVLVSPQWIEQVSWAEAKVRVDLSQDAIRNSPEYDPAAPVNRDYEERLYDYYGRPR